MIINHNLPGNNAISRMNANSATASKSMQKLSSGLRINSAADDAAGLAISEKMRGQIRGLDTAAANAQDGISMIQTGEGALNETTSILQRMRELAVQSSNDTNNSDDRSAIQTEMKQLTSEINRIGNTTEFNTQKILNGDIKAAGTVKSESAFSAGGGVASVAVAKSSSLSAGSYHLAVTVDATGKQTGNVVSSTTGISNVTVASGSTIATGAYHVDVASTAVKSFSPAGLDNSISSVSVATNSALADGGYRIQVTRTDATALTAANGTGITSVTLSGTDAVSAATGYSVEVAKSVNGQTAEGAGNGVVNAVSIAANSQYGGQNLVLKGTGTAGTMALYASDGTTKISADIILDDGVQDYTVFAPDGTTATGITFTTLDNAATTLGVAAKGVNFDVDANLTLKDNLGATVGNTTVAANTAAGNATITVGADTYTIAHGGTIGGAATGIATGLTGGTGAATLDVTNTLSAQLQTGAGVNVPGASPVTFTAGATNVSLANGVSFNSDADITKYSAAAPENSSFTVNSSNQLVATLKDSGNSQVTGSKQVVLSNNTNNLSFGNGVSFDVGTAGAATATFNITGTSVYTGTLTDGSGTAVAAKTLSASSQIDFGKGIIATTGSSLSAGTADFTVATNSEDTSLSMQIGANQGQSFSVDINDMRANALGISGTAGGGTIRDNKGVVIENATYVASANVTDGTNSTNAEYSLDVSTAEKASAAIKVIDNAITTVSGERAKLGAFQNRLEHTIANLGTSSENLTSAESRVRDVDMAKEMATFSKNNILAQAAQAMLAQANQQPQQVLQLLR